MKEEPILSLTFLESHKEKETNPIYDSILKDSFLLNTCMAGVPKCEIISNFAHFNCDIIQGIFET